MGSAEKGMEKTREEKRQKGSERAEKMGGCKKGGCKKGGCQVTWNANQSAQSLE
tara:strand:- start:307 stop:468 length:162 start_codon:yes stop_codon:yes gene_type:complete